MLAHTPFESVSPSVLERVAADLAAAAETREAQLAALPPATTLVAAAHRDSIVRILTAIADAQARLADGTYGTCRRCDRPADVRLTLSRPWAPLCVAHGR